MHKMFVLTASLLLLWSSNADARDNDRTRTSGDSSTSSNQSDGKGSWLNGERKGGLKNALEGKVVGAAGNGHLKQDFRALQECSDCDHSFFNTREAYDLNDFEKANTLEHWQGFRSQKENGLPEELQ